MCVGFRMHRHDCLFLRRSPAAPNDLTLRYLPLVRQEEGISVIVQAMWDV